MFWQQFCWELWRVACNRPSAGSRARGAAHYLINIYYPILRQKGRRSLFINIYYSITNCKKPWDHPNPVLELKQSNKYLQIFTTQSWTAHQSKRSGTNSESSDALPAIGTIILASFMLLHRAGTLKLHQHKARVDCCVWNWSIWFLGDETFWQQFWEIWRVACNRYWGTVALDLVAFCWEPPTAV